MRKISDQFYQKIHWPCHEALKQNSEIIKTRETTLWHSTFSGFTEFCLPGECDYTRISFLRLFPPDAYFFFFCQVFTNSGNLLQLKWLMKKLSKVQDFFLFNAKTNLIYFCSIWRFSDQFGVFRWLLLLCALRLCLFLNDFPGHKKHGQFSTKPCTIRMWRFMLLLWLLS